MLTSGDLKSGDSIICIIHPEKYQFILYCLTKKIIEIIFFSYKYRYLTCI